MSSCVTNSPNGFISRRSPLELGTVTFPQPTSFNNQLIVHLPHRNSNIHSSSIVYDKWITGKVNKHHEFIPAHVKRIYVQTPKVDTPNNSLDVEEHVSTARGGFGVGYNVGGSGAGHGFQIVFTN